MSRGRRPVRAVRCSAVDARKLSADSKNQEAVSSRLAVRRVLLASGDVPSEREAAGGAAPRVLARRGGKQSGPHQEPGRRGRAKRSPKASDEPRCASTAVGLPVSVECRDELCLGVRCALGVGHRGNHEAPGELDGTPVLRSWFWFEGASVMTVRRREL